MLKVISSRSSKKSIGSKIHSMLIGPVFKCPTSVMKIMFTITKLPLEQYKYNYMILHKDCTVCLKYNVQRQKLLNKDRNRRCFGSRLNSDLFGQNSPKEREDFGYRGHDIDHMLEHQPKQNLQQFVFTGTQSRDWCKTVLSFTSRLHQTTENSGFYCYTGD